MRPTGVTTERFAGFAYRPHGDTLAVARLCRKSVDADRLTVRSVLTFPVHDLAGDYVRPEGLDFSTFARDPRIDVEHSLHPDFGALTVAWCRKSLSKPGAPLAVEVLDLDVDGTRHRLPVGTSYFDPNSRASMQVFRLVESDALPGVSLEFRPLAGRPLGKSLLEPRDAYEFTRCDVRRYTHCATPVNPGALTVTKSLDALTPIVQTGRLGSEALDPVLLGVLRKSLSAYTPKRVLVRVEKAMPDVDDDDTADTPETVYDDAVGDDPAALGDAAPEAPATPTVQAHYDFVQGCLDLCAKGESDLAHSEHVKGREAMFKDMEKIKVILEGMKARGDKIDGELSGNKPATDDEPVGDEIETDDDGTMKAIRAVYKSRLKRFSSNEIQKASAAAAATASAEDPHVLAARLLAEQLAAKTREDEARKALEAELARERKRLERDYARLVG